MHPVKAEFVGNVQLHLCLQRPDAAKVDRCRIYFAWIVARGWAGPCRLQIWAHRVRPSRHLRAGRKRTGAGRPAALPRPPAGTCGIRPFILLGKTLILTQHTASVPQARALKSARRPAGAAHPSINALRAAPTPALAGSASLTQARESAFHQQTRGPRAFYAHACRVSGQRESGAVRCYCIERLTR